MGLLVEQEGALGVVADGIGVAAAEAGSAIAGRSTADLVPGQSVYICKPAATFGIDGTCQNTEY